MTNGTYVEHLLIGLIKSVTSDGTDVMVVGMSLSYIGRRNAKALFRSYLDLQNKLKATIICQSLDDSTQPFYVRCVGSPGMDTRRMANERADRVYYHTIHKIDGMSVLILKLCKHNGLVVSRPFR